MSIITEKIIKMLGDVNGHSLNKVKNLGSKHNNDVACGLI